MANRFQKFVYALSAEAPLLFVIAVVLLIENSDGTNPISKSWKIPVVLIAISALLGIAFNWFFKQAMNNLQIIPVVATKFSSGDAWIIAYVISYILPLATFQFRELTISVLVIAIGILLAALTFTDYVIPHPLIYLKGYKFYKVDIEGAASGCYLISKRRITSAVNIKEVAQVFDFLLIKME